MSKARERKKGSGPVRGRTNIIEPTVGRVLWLFPKKWAKSDDFQPLAAQVAFVHDERLVNVGYLDENGCHKNATNVLLLQHGDDEPEEGVMHLRWMPFQIGQAKAQGDLKAPGDSTPGGESVDESKAAEPGGDIPNGETEEKPVE